MVTVMEQAKSKQKRQSGPPSFGRRENEEQLHREEMLDEALQATFPASDPLAVTEPGGCRGLGAGRRRAAA